MNPNIEHYHNKLVEHPIYQQLNSLEDLKIFMEYHVYAVWDFMSLLKSLQNTITCTQIPWRPSSYSSKATRLINEIVLAEESDINPEGKPSSHFELYIEAMKEVGARTSLIGDFIESNDLSLLAPGVSQFVKENIELSCYGAPEEVAAAFFYGREKLLPDVFTQIVRVIKDNEINCPSLIYYFKRHIELDGDEHGPAAKECLEEICAQDAAAKARAQKSAIKALEARINLWDTTLQAIQKNR